MVGGFIENDETPLQAAIRECHEELGKDAIFFEDKFELVMEFDEIATSDQKNRIHFFVFQYNGTLEGFLTISEEIEQFMWFGLNDDVKILSNTLKNKVIPFCLEKGMLYDNIKETYLK